MAKKVPYALKISADTRARLRQFCDERGVLQSHLVEEALAEKLDREELLEDTLEFKRWKHEEPHRRPFEQYRRTGSERTPKRSYR